MQEIREEYLGYNIVIQKPDKAACKKAVGMESGIFRCL